MDLRADQCHYRYPGEHWGPADSSVTIDDAWRCTLPPPNPIRIVERRGYDISPIDAPNAGAELTLLSYV